MLPIVLYTLAYILGIIGGLYNICIVPIFLIICMFIFIKKDMKKSLILLLVFFVGIGYTVFRVDLYDRKYNNVEVEDNFVVISDLIEKENSNSYIVKASNGDKFILYTNKEVILKYGSKILLKGNLEIPLTSRNRRWL